MYQGYSTRSPAVRRLMKEAKELCEPTEQYFAQPLEDNLFEWHFTIRGPEDTEFEGGIYHGRIVLPHEYPMKPPSIYFLTHNGRFETNTKICLSISGHHPESWQPSWSIRTALLAMIGFMPTPGTGAIGALNYPKEERQKLARKSRNSRCHVCGDIPSKLKPVTSASKKDRDEAKELGAQLKMQGEKKAAGASNAAGDSSNQQTDDKPREPDDNINIADDQPDGETPTSGEVSKPNESSTSDSISKDTTETSSQQQNSTEYVNRERSQSFDINPPAFPQMPMFAGFPPNIQRFPPVPFSGISPIGFPAMRPPFPPMIRPTRIPFNYRPPMHPAFMAMMQFRMRMQAPPSQTPSSRPTTTETNTSTPAQTRARPRRSAGERRRYNRLLSLNAKLIVIGFLIVFLVFFRRMFNVYSEFLEEAMEREEL